MALLHFIKEVTARITGDEAGVVAAKNARKAESAIKGQIAALESTLVDSQSKVEDTIEALDNAKYPKNLITDNQSYVNGIKRAQEAYEKANDDQHDIESSIEYFKGRLVEFEGADFKGE